MLLPPKRVLDEGYIIEYVKRLGIQINNVYFLKKSLVVEITDKITRSQIKEIEQATYSRFEEIGIRQSPGLGYETIVELFFSRV